MKPNEEDELQAPSWNDPDWDRHIDELMRNETFRQELRDAAAEDYAKECAEEAARLRATANIPDAD